MYKKRKLKFSEDKPFKPGDIDWLEGVKFRDPEYRIHPIMGHQVRSRHKFESDEPPLEERGVEKKSTGFRQPRLRPYEADPKYRDKGEQEHGEADLKGVKQQKVTIGDLTIFELPAFRIKSDRLRRSVQILDIKLGYDHRTNRQVLYSPLKYNERWDRQSQVIWLRIIGMSPKRISIKLKIKYDTVKNWLRALKDQPLVALSQYDWAIRQIEGKPEFSTRFSSIEAKPRSMEVIK